MLKAYLAHSSEDKNYVERVANHLGRAQVVYDKMCFEAGVDFRDSIIDGLDKSGLFIFFASKHSLKSLYVNFEIAEANWQLLRDEMGGAITIIIDKDVKVSELPLWMQRSLVAVIESPTQSARIIRRHLIQASGLDKQRPFVGREGDLAEFAHKLIAPPDEMPSRIIVVSGLPGVGRRTFIRRALRDYLSLETGPVLLLSETASLDNLHWQLLGETAEVDSRNEVAKILTTFAELTMPEKGREIARLVTIIARDNVAPVIVDHNALLDDHGRYLDWFVYILDALKDFEDTYLVLIHNRRPDLTVIANTSPRVAFHRLDPLNLENTQMLLQQTLRLTNIEATTHQTKQLALYMGGYPPTVELACTYAKFYGLEILIADKSILTDFQVGTFAPILKRLGLKQREWELLRLLAGELSLPIEVLTAVLRISQEDCAYILRNVVDINLVLPLDHNFAISPPVQEAVNRIHGPLTKSEYKTIAVRLRKAFWTDPNKVPPLGIVDAIIHALSRSDVKGLQDFHDLILPSQLYRAAKEEYDLKNWDGAINFAKRALEADPSRDGARIILCKALVRTEQWKEAELVLKKLEARGVRAQFYCKGFLEWKRGNLGAAVSAFRSALSAGDKSISVLRDLAHCLFRLGKMEDAKKYCPKVRNGCFVTAM